MQATLLCEQCKRRRCHSQETQGRLMISPPAPINKSLPVRSRHKSLLKWRFARKTPPVANDCILWLPKGKSWDTDEFPLSRSFSCPLHGIYLFFTSYTNSLVVLSGDISRLTGFLGGGRWTSLVTEVVVSHLAWADCKRRAVWRGGWPRPVENTNYEFLGLAASESI